MSDELFPRKGPWKKLVNSPGLLAEGAILGDGSGAIGFGWTFDATGGSLAKGATLAL
jgi:hypothetical protein